MRPAGFTLLELLVVMTIIGLMAGLALLSTGQLGSRHTEQAGQRLAGQIELARDQALLTGQSLAIGVARDHLAVMEQQWLDDRSLRWVPLEEGALRPANFGSMDLQPRLYIEDRRVSLNDDPDENLIAINAAGEIQPFELILEPSGGGSAPVRLSSDGNQRVRVGEKD